MKIPFRSLLALATITVGLCPALADTQDCGEDAKAVLSQAYPSAQPDADGTRLLLDGHIAIELPADDAGSAHAVVCKIWPAQPGLTLIAVPLIDTRQSGDDQTIGDLDLLVVDAKTRQIRQRLRQPGLMSDNAITISTVAFDTSVYRLRPDVPAFGLRRVIVNKSARTPFNETDLWLYAIENGELHSVLDKLAVATNAGANNDDCTGQSESSQVTLSMGGAVRNGHRDIIATSKVTEEADHPGKNGACVTKTTGHSTRIYRLGYDGKHYIIPKPLRASDVEKPDAKP